MIHEFNFYIYPRKLWVTYDATPDELNRTLTRGDTNERPFKEMPKSCDASTDATGDKDHGGVLIRFESKEYVNEENIAHEAVHAADFIFDYIGSEHDIRNDESYAYLVGYIAKCCAIARDNEVKEKQEE